MKVFFVLFALCSFVIPAVAEAGKGLHKLYSQALSVVVAADGCISVKDKRTGRLWECSSGDISGLECELVGKNVLEFEMKAVNSEMSGRIRLSLSGAELSVELSFCSLPTGGAVYPGMFNLSAGDAVVLPLSEGFRLPPGCELLKGEFPAWKSTLSMPFFGITDESDTAGWMAILETPEDATLQARRSDDVFTSPAPCWKNEKGMPGYTRRVRYVFFDRGGYVAMAKRYRKYARKNALLLTLSEKMKTRPLVGRLPGAANIWYFPSKGEPSHSIVAKEIRDAGINRFLWSSFSTREDVREISAMPDVLAGRYDVCRDVYFPDLLKALGLANPPASDICRNTSAWPQDIIWNRPESNSWRRAWGVMCKDGRKRNCAAQCDIPAVARTEYNVSSELAAIPFTARFVDVLAAVGWEECSNPAHPMTRRTSRKAKSDLLRMLGERFSLVVGSEQGMDAVVPFCDYFEGMMSPACARMPHGRKGYGRKEIFRDDGSIPGRLSPREFNRVVDFGLNEKYRIPLFELVYHDCVCSHWYWYDYSNHPLALWKKRDLFNTLYGTAPMYVFDYRLWRERKEQFVKSYKTVCSVARQTGFSEMMSHRALNAQRTVQETRFADGTTVVADFGKEKVVVKKK